MQNVSVSTQAIIKFESIQKRFSKRIRKPGRNSEAKVKSVSCNEDYPHAPYAHTFPSVVMETVNWVTFPFKRKKRVLCLFGNKNVCTDPRVQRVKM